jgi:DNA repair protein RecO (recombination protein O)
MPLVKTEGVILQQRPFSESSKILVVYTRDSGRVSLLFKGGRKGSKKFPGGLETLNRVNLQYYYKQGRDLQNFKEFDLIEAYPNVRLDLPRTFTALSIAETILRTTVDEDQNSDVYIDLIAALTALNHSDRHPWALRWKSLLGLCRGVGFALNLEDCSRCGSKNAMIGFDLAAGGFICSDHSPNGPDITEASGEIWGILRFLSSCTYGAANRIVVSPKVGRRIEALFDAYFHYHVPGLKSFESWRKLPELYWEDDGI